MLPGVYTARKKDGTIYFRSNITHRGKHISLGSYTTETEAHEAYLAAACILKDLALTPDNLDGPPHILHFEKKISLMNFRDNHIYFKTPIYLKSNYFLYFLSPHEELKFDADDLFFYSSHKLMRRKGHLFVSEYGMQTNILSRYGIKNFAVCGKDYYFVNGDSTDFRYSNIAVINKYYGVSKVTQKGRVCYKAKINIIGCHVLGIYPTEELAAIAYNKAVDAAKKHGVSKAYSTNYLTELSAREYAESYTSLTISPKYLAYLKKLPPEAMKPRC